MSENSSSAPRVWIPVLLIALAGLGPALFQVGQGREVSMDDAYIHFRYARHLAESGHLQFNPGETRGVGTTSALWVLLLAGGMLMGIDPITFARILAVISLALATICVYHLARPTFVPLTATSPGSGALCVAGLFALSGNMIWFTLSGMETVAFLALGLLALVCYQRGWWAGVGAGIGLAILCRPEGLALLPTIGALEALHLTRGGAPKPRAWTVAALLAIIPAVLWFLSIHQATGHWLPTTFAGKRAYHGDVIRHFMGEIPALALYTGSARVMFLVLWVSYALLYVFGGAGFPGPSLVYAGEVGSQVSIHLSLLGLALAAFVATPLLVRGLHSLVCFIRQLSFLDGGASGSLGIWLWAGLHNTAYLMLLPGPGTATRYQAINHLLLWWLIALGLFSWRRHHGLFVAAGLAVVSMVIADVVYWRSVYIANLDHMQRVRIQAACYVADEVPSDARVAAYDIGAVGYYSDRCIVDLGGLTDTDFVIYQQEGRVDEYLRDRGADYLVLPGRHSLDREDLFDFAAYLGLDRTPLFRLSELAAFENEREVWARGEQATGNYQPSVRIYRIDWGRPQVIGG